MQEDAQAPRTRNCDVRAARTACATAAEAPGTTVQGRQLRQLPPIENTDFFLIEINFYFFNATKVEENATPIEYVTVHADGITLIGNWTHDGKKRNIDSKTYIPENVTSRRSRRI